MKPWVKTLDSLTDHGRGLERKLHDVLVRAPDYTPDKEEEYKPDTQFMGNIFLAYDQFLEEEDERHGRFGDMFGSWMIENEMRNSATGQFFTPVHICDAMVQVSLPSRALELGSSIVRFLDPAAGTGRFMLRTAKHYHEHLGYYNFLFTNVDIDFRVYVFCVMNAILHHIPSIHIWGNSLSNKGYEMCVFYVDNGVPHWEFMDKEKTCNHMDTWFKFKSSIPNGQRSLVDIEKPPSRVEIRRRFKDMKTTVQKTLF